MIRKLTLCALLGVSISAHAADVLIPNGNFSTPGGADFGFFESFAGVVSFPASGGSGDDGGYGLVNNTIPGASWGGGLVSPPDNAFPANQGIPLANLGLVAGNTYTFSMDMKNFAGSGTGGLKLEAWNGGGTSASNTGDMPASGSSSSWATYSWNYPIPVGTLSIKIVPLLTGASGGSTADSVGFDNIKVNNTPVIPPPIVPVIPNSGFEIQPPADTKWSFFTNGFGLTWSTTGGNPNGHTIIDGTLGGAGATYGVLVANNNAPQTLASLGLTAGETYTFTMDMKIVSGTQVGGMKVEFIPGFSGELFPALIGDGSTWETYSFQITLPPACTQIQVVPLGRKDSVVAYDNVKILLPEPPPPFSATIEKGTVVGWSVSNAANSYQPQKRNAVEDPWTDIGGPVAGTSVPYVFQQTPSNFYQVVESEPALLENAVQNPGFETAGTPPATPALKWNTLVSINGGTATAAASYTGGFTPHSGAQMLVLESVTPAEGPVAAPDIVVRSDNFAITENTSYDLSFWAAHVVKIGGGNPQFSIFYQDGFGGPVGGPVFVSFASIGDTWTKVQHTFTTPAGAATMNVGWIQAVGAGNAWQWVTLLDDVELLTPTLEGNSEVIPATAGPGVEISWQTVEDRTYQVRSSGNLVDWTNFGSSVVGDGSIFSVADPITPPGKKFYTVGETP